MRSWRTAEGEKNLRTRNPRFNEVVSTNLQRPASCSLVHRSFVIDSFNKNEGGDRKTRTRWKDRATAAQSISHQAPPKGEQSNARDMRVTWPIVNPASLSQLSAL